MEDKPESRNDNLSSGTTTTTKTKMKTKTKQPSICGILLCTESRVPDGFKRTIGGSGSRAKAGLIELWAQVLCSVSQVI